MTGPRQEETSLDPWTLGGIAVVAYALGNLVHEGLGHGGACLLVGGRPETLNAVFFSCDVEGLPASAERWLAAGGSIANLIVAGLAFLALRLLPQHRGPVRDFAWLTLALGLLMPFGYLLFSGLGGIGDWVVVIRGLRPVLLWRTLLAAAGAVLYFWLSPRILMPLLDPFLGAGAERVPRARRLTLLPYLVGGATFLAAGALNPHGAHLVLISAAAASFGGTSLLAWYPPLFAARVPGSSGAPPLGVPRSWAWISAAAVTLAIFVGWLGPGIDFHPGR